MGVGIGGHKLQKPYASTGAAMTTS
ncbi:uncharacterized protein G2W53_007389 [Senna tora]|uniref:Uncharacterized protein n=1 Tax=Senna tora TaxID=362788 RepID=A0A835CH92_9FABA|nr:uncharacterized protein G2W53_007389 [Senna tora]